MAKNYYKAPTHNTGTVITTKTPFGSTSDMVIDHTKYRYIENKGPITLNDIEVICKDDRGFYITLKDRLDTGRSDPNRYANAFCRLNIVEEQENLNS
jgi:hypothetical protein